MELQRRFFQAPNQSFFLFGPRGTGKSTWLHRALPDALFIDLLQPDVARELAARPERLVDLIRGAPKSQTVVVDEVQRVPELLNVVHALLESQDRRQFVLTGSSARKLRRGRVWILPVDEFLRSLDPARGLPNWPPPTTADVTAPLA
jgi:predicted AAA+ superfamily ATPase